jgi:hypothetical protein
MTNEFIQKRLDKYVQTSEGRKAEEIDKNLEYYTKFFNTTYSEFNTQFTDKSGREYFFPESKEEKFPFNMEIASKIDGVRWKDKIIFIKIKKKFREKFGWPKNGEKIIAYSDKVKFSATVESVFFGERRATGWCKVNNLITFSFQKD